jgi:hypothetical protein
VPIAPTSRTIATCPACRRCRQVRPREARDGNGKVRQKLNNRERERDGRSGGRERGANCFGTVLFLIGTPALPSPSPPPTLPSAVRPPPPPSLYPSLTLIRIAARWSCAEKMEYSISRGLRFARVCAAYFQFKTVHRSIDQEKSIGLHFFCSLIVLAFKLHDWCKIEHLEHFWRLYGIMAA